MSEDLQTVWVENLNKYFNTASKDPREIEYMGSVAFAHMSRERFYALTPLDTDRASLVRQKIQEAQPGLIGTAAGVAGQGVRGAAAGVVEGVQTLGRLGVGSMMDLFNTLRYNYEKNKLTDRVTWINTNIKRENYASDEEWQAARESALQQYRNELAEVERRFVNVADFGREEMQKMKTRHENWMKQAGLSKEEGDGFFYDIGQGAGSLLSALAVSFVTKSPSAAAALFGGIAGRQGYEEALENGVAPDKALWVGAAAGTAEGVLERLGLDVFLKGLSARGWSKRVIKNALTEAVQEGSQGIAEEVILGTMGGREKQIEDALQDVAYQALLGGLIGGGVAGIPGIGKMFAEYSQADKEAIAREQQQMLAAPSVQEAEELMRANEGRGLTAQERYRLILANGVRRLSDLGVSQEQAQRAAAQVILEAGSEKSIAEVRQMLNDENNPATYTNNDILESIKEFAEAVRATSKRLTPQYMKQTYDIRERVTQDALAAGYSETEAEAAGQLQQAFSQLSYQITGMSPAAWYEKNQIQFRKAGASNSTQAQENKPPQMPKAKTAALQTEQNEISTPADTQVVLAQENELEAAREYYRRSEEEQARADAEANAELDIRLQEEGINPDDLYFQRADVGGADMFVPDAQTAQRFKAEVRKTLSDQSVAAGTLFDMGNLPAIYVELGLPPGSLKTNKTTLLKATGKAGRNLHDVPQEVLENLPALVADPLAVFKSSKNSQNPLGYVAVLNAKNKDGKQIIAVISPKGGKYDFSFIPSVYERNNFDNFAKNTLREKGVLYVKDETVPPSLHDAVLRENTVSTNRILTKEDFVKPEIMQQNGPAPMGQTEFTDTAAVITLLERANKSTLLHEMGHVFLRQLERMQQEYDTPLMRQYTRALEAFLGPKQNGRFYSREQQERFARSFLSYVRENEAPNAEMKRVFDRFKEWLDEIYQSVRGTAFFERISPQAKEFFDEILAPVDVETPPMTLYQGQEENIRRAVQDIKQNRLPEESTGLTLQDIKALYSQLRKRMPKKPSHNLLKDLRRYGAEYANAGHIDQEAYKNALVYDKKGGVGDQPDVWLRDKGYMDFDQSTPETRAQAWNMIERALNNEEIYRLQDQQAAQQREDYRHELEIVRNISSDYQDAQFVLKKIAEIEQRGYRVADKSDLELLRKSIEKLTQMSAEQKEELENIKEELVEELQKRVDDDGALKAALSEIIHAKTKEQIANRFKRAEKVIVNSIIKEAAGVSETVQVPEDFYTRVREEAQEELTAQQRLEQKGIHMLKESGFWSKALVPVSTRLRKISEPLMYKMRQFLARSSRKNNENLRAITPFLSKLRSLQKENRGDWKVLDFALKNRDVRTRDRLLKKYGMEGEFAKVRDLLNDMYRRAAAVGMDVNFLTEYFPRKVINPAEFISYMQGTAQWSQIERLLKLADPEEKFTEEEVANFINNWLRGYASRDLARGVPGNLKERQITFITRELDAFYKSSDQALLDYVLSVEKAIQAKTLLGLDLSKYEESLGHVISRLLKTGKLNHIEEKELKKMISAVVKPDSTASAVSFIKNAGYITTMGNPLSAVTQLGDLAFAAYSSGIWGTVSTAVGNKEIKVEDLGLEQLAQEFFEPRKTFKGNSALAKFGNTLISPKAVDTTFKLVGLNKIDRLGKETFVNSKYQQLQKQAHDNPQQLMEYLTRFMGENEAAEVWKDLNDGVVSEAVKDLLFSEISEFQPVSLLEMPQYYLTHGGSRLFYALKTYTIKQIDIFRNQCFERMLNGNREEKIKAFKDFMRLCILVMIANAGADTLKDLILGRQIDLEDLAVDNLLRLTGLSKYQLYRFRDNRQDLGIAAAYMIMPPALSLPTDIFWDGYRVAHGKKDFKDMRIFSNIPGFGKLYYWWFGGGKAITQKDNKNKGLFKITGWAGEIE